jgi:hypothetical protein
LNRESNILRLEWLELINVQTAIGLELCESMKHKVKEGKARHDANAVVNRYTDKGVNVSESTWNDEAYSELVGVHPSLDKRKLVKSMRRDDANRSAVLRLSW